MALYERWFEVTREDKVRKRYWTYSEKTGGRDKVRGDLTQTIRSHYMPLERIADDVARLGFGRAAKILRARLPQDAKFRSGELGEILATELVEEEIGFRVPVRRLRYKDGRNAPMRGDDLIGLAYDGKDAELRLLKGEAKSNKVLRKATVNDARSQLDCNHGRCKPESLLFVADRLLESADEDDNELGRHLRDEVGLQSLPADRIDHMLFTVSGNGPPTALKKDLEAAGHNRNQYAVNLHIADHQEFIAEMYAEVENLGDD